MLKSIEFKNFKALRDTTLPLGRFTLIVGPNGSGKSTAIQAIRAKEFASSWSYETMLSADAPEGSNVELTFNWDSESGDNWTRWTFSKKEGAIPSSGGTSKRRGVKYVDLRQRLHQTRVYSLDAKAIAAPVALTTHAELASDGGGLAAVLDGLRDMHPERFEALNTEISRWIPEFDRILFDVPSEGHRGFLLRIRHSEKPVPAAELSDGTLHALALLTMAYLPDPPPLIGLEEPDHGIHPRLMRNVKDALYRLSYPESVGEDREPIQVVATTHSPYFVDLFKDRPEEIVIANKQGLNVVFERLSDQPHIQEVLGEDSLGEAWFSGVLGGVPSAS